MSTRTIVEINHDYLHDLIRQAMPGSDLHAFLIELGGSSVTGELNRHYRVTRLSGAITAYRQRHHSESVTVSIPMPRPAGEALQALLRRVVALEDNRHLSDEELNTMLDGLIADAAAIIPQLSETE